MLHKLAFMLRPTTRPSRRLTGQNIPALPCMLLLMLVNMFGCPKKQIEKTPHVPAATNYPTIASAPGTPINVLTQHNNNYRTGANINERVLNTDNVNSATFGKLFTRPVEGDTYAQPLYVSGLTMPDGSSHNVVYVGTMANFVYAFDADDPAASVPLWRVSLGTPVPFDFMPMPEVAGIGCTLGILAHDKRCGYNIERSFGILGTPVIDLQSKTLYAVAATQDPSTTVAYSLHALDLVTHAEKFGGPVLIQGSVTTTIRTASGPPQQVPVTFDPKVSLQRPGLLLLNGVLYIAFGSHQAILPWHGWLMSYDASTLKQLNVRCITPKGHGGSIWQSGNGPSADDAGFIYVMTADGTFENVTGGPPPTDLSNGFIKFDGQLNVQDWFTPEDADDFNSHLCFIQSQALDVDFDLGSAGPLLVPRDPQTGGVPLVMGGGKTGVFYVLNREHLGHYHSHDSESVLQRFTAVPAEEPNICGLGYRHIHGSPVTWLSAKNGSRLVYVWGEDDYLRSFRLLPTGLFETKAAFVSKPKAPSGTPFLHKMPGGILSISASGDTPGSGIVWASLALDNSTYATVPGVLRAFKADDLNEIWNSKEVENRDDVGNFAKFAAPTVANGKVYVPTFSDQLDVYGLQPAAKVVSQNPPPANMVIKQKAHVSVTMKNTGGAWPPGSTFTLALVQPVSPATWGIAKNITMKRYVQTGEDVSMDFDVTAPSSPGTYNFQWQMVDLFGQPFGEATAPVTVTVAWPDPPPLFSCKAEAVACNDLVTIACDASSAPDAQLVLQRASGLDADKKQTWSTVDIQYGGSSPAGRTVHDEGALGDSATYRVCSANLNPAPNCPPDSAAITLALPHKVCGIGEGQAGAKCGVPGKPRCRVPDNVKPMPH